MITVNVVGDAPMVKNVSVYVPKHYIKSLGEFMAYEIDFDWLAIRFTRCGGGKPLTTKDDFGRCLANITPEQR